MTKQGQIYETVRARIFDGTFAPGMRLNMDALSRELGVSQIPVREAMRRLEAEGWVRFRPNAGVEVAPVDETFWEKAMEALALLEGQVSASAAPNLRTEDFAELTRINNEMSEAIYAFDPLRFSQLNWEFHEVIYARCPNDYICRLISETKDRLARVRDTMFAYLPHRSRAAIDEHAQLIGLLQHGDAGEIERFARWHKLQTIEAYRKAHAEAATTKAVAPEPQA